MDNADACQRKRDAGDQSSWQLGDVAAGGGWGRAGRHSGSSVLQVALAPQLKRETSDQPSWQLGEVAAGMAAGRASVCSGTGALHTAEFEKLLKMVTGLRGLGILELKGQPALPALTKEGLVGSFWSWPEDAQGLDTSSDIAWCRALLQRKLLQDANRVQRRILEMRSAIVQSRSKAIKRLEQINGTDFAEEQVSSVVRRFTSIQNMTEQLQTFVMDTYKGVANILHDFDVVLSPPGTMSMVSTGTVMPLIIEMFGLSCDEGPGVLALRSARKSTRANSGGRVERVPSKSNVPERSRSKLTTMLTASYLPKLPVSPSRAQRPGDEPPGADYPCNPSTPTLEVMDVLPVDDASLQVESCNLQEYRRGHLLAGPGSVETCGTPQKPAGEGFFAAGGSDASDSDSETSSSVSSGPVSLAERCLSTCWRWMVPPILIAVKELEYSRSSFRADLMAALIISAAGIPKAMSYAALTGLPVAAGIVTMYVPCVVYALMGHSRQGAVSPQSVPCLLLAALVEEDIEGFESDEGERAALTLIYTLVTGAVITTMGLLQMSFLLQFISKPVLSGFISASSLIAAASTAKSLLGIKLQKSPLLHETLAYIVQGLPKMHPATTAVSVAFILLYLLYGNLKKLATRRSKHGRGWKACALVLKVPVVVPIVLFGAFLGACLCNFQPFTKWAPEHVVLGCGSSSAALIYDTAGQGFNQSKYHDRSTVQYSALGSGEGLRQVMHEGPWVDFGSSDVRPSEAELQQGNISATFPVVSTWICPIANVPITRSSHQISLVMDLPLLAGIFDGNVTHWSDPRIHRLNPNLPWSGVSQRITVVTRSGSSGTTYHFSQALATASTSISPSMRASWGAPLQVLAQSNAAVVKAVASAEWTVGYATLSEVIASSVATSACVALSTSQGIITAERARESGGTLPWPFQQTAHVLIPMGPVVAQAGLPRQSFCAARRLLHDYFELVFQETKTAASLGMQLMPRPPGLDAILCSTGRRLTGSSAPPAKCSSIKMVGYIEPSVPSFSMPVTQVQLDVASVVTKSLMLAVVILLEHVAIVKHYAEKHDHSLPVSADLVAVGLANVVGALSGSFIVACGLSRSALNASAVSQVSLLLSAAISLVIVYVFAPVISMLPDPVLGVVLLMAVIHMVDIQMLRTLAKLRFRGMLDLVAVTVAFFATCVLGVVQGMITAVAFSLVVFIFNSTYPQISELRRKVGSATFYNARSYDGVMEIANRICPVNEPVDSGPLLVLRFEAALWFANVGRLRDVVMARLPAGNLKTLVLDMSTVPWMDTTAAVEFDKLLVAAQDHGVEVLLVAASPVVRDMLVGISGKKVFNSFFDSVYEAQLPKRQTAWEL